MNCKSCSEFVDRVDFEFAKDTALFREPGSYCQNCYATHISPAKFDYDSMLEKAKEIQVYEIQQSKETRLMKRKEAMLEVKDVYDREDAILRLAFKAVIQKMNAIIDVDLKSVKVQNGKHQHQVWSGKARPTHV